MSKKRPPEMVRFITCKIYFGSSHEKVFSIFKTNQSELKLPICQECKAIICSRRLQQTTFSDAFFLCALRVKVMIAEFVYKPLKRQSGLQQTTNFETSFTIFDKNKV